MQNCFQFKFQCTSVSIGLFVFCLFFFSSNVACSQNVKGNSQKIPGHYLPVGDSKIYYEEAGNGQAVILIHDGLVNSMTWDGEWSKLTKTFHVIRYDRRGFGLSDLPVKPFSQPEDLYTLLTYLKIPHATIVGCSSGGGVAIDFTLVHPEMVDRLILIGSVLHGMVVTKSFIERGNKNNEPLRKADVRRVAENWANDPFTIIPKDTTARKKLYHALLKYPQNLKYTGDLEIRLPVPAVRRLSEIHVPTLILVGESDIPDVQAFGGAIQAGIPGARREMVNGSAHLVPLEVPDYLSKRITNFIRMYPSVNIPINILQDYAGNYQLWGETVTVAIKDKMLWLQILEEWDIPLFPESDAKFRLFMWTQDAEIEFKKDSMGKVKQAKIIAEDGTINNCPRK